MKWIGRVMLAVLSLFVLARAASAQQAYSVPPGYVKASNPEAYLPDYPAGGIPVTMGADGRYYAQTGSGQAGYAESGYAQGGYAQEGYAQGGYSQGVAVSGCCGGAPQPYPQPYPVPQPVPQPCGGQPPACGGYGGGYQGGGYQGGYPAGGVVVVEETCGRGCGGGGYPAPPSSLIPPGYVPIAQYVETVPCGGGCGGGYPPPAPPPCCAPPAPPPSCDWRRPPNTPYACPPGWGEVTLKDSFFWGGGGVGPEYIPGGGGGGGYASAGAGAGAYAYASASASVRVNIGGRGGGKPHRPKPRGGKCGCH